jgi:ATP-dependent helicase HrpA
VQDPRDRPLDRQAAADQAHARFKDEKSEFAGYLKLWAFFEEARDELTNRKLAAACQKNFLSVRRMREWRDVHSQLVQLADEQGWRASEKPANHEQIHRALLTGLLGNIGLKSDAEAHYLGARGIRFYPHPGSSLGRKAGKWVMAAELVETTRLYARTLANIDPQWLEEAGAHLLKRSWHDPRWEKNAARPMALERATLYGIPVYTQRRIEYAKVDAKHARELFIRGALVAGEFETRAPFFAHNQRLTREIEELEHKSRRPDVLVDDELIYAFYDAAIPARVVDGTTFEIWRKDAERTDPKLLFLKRDDLMRHEAAGITTDLFPKKARLSAGPIEFAFTYHFEPGSPRDGVTAAVPLAALNQIDADRCDWLVPGMRKERALALLKSLPQKLRRGCVPLPDFAAGFAAAHAGEAVPAGPMAAALGRWIREKTAVVVPGDAFKLETIPAHLVMNFKVVDEHGRQLDMGRNLVQLRAAHADRATASFASAARARLGAGTASAGATSADAKAATLPGRVLHESRTQWDFGALEEIVEVGALIGYPALVDTGGAVNVELFDEPGAAAVAHVKGLARLLRLALTDQIRFLEKNLNVRAIGLMYSPFGGERELVTQLIEAAIRRACLAAPLPRMEAEFAKRRDEGRARLSLIAQEITALVTRILEAHQGLQKKLAGAKAFAAALQDINGQLQRLLPKDFIVALPYERLTHVPRYLQAISIRIEKLRADPARDTRVMTEFTPLAQAHVRRMIELARAGSADPRLEEFRWLLEELRVSLFAQELRTPMPVSVKRLTKVWETYRSL